MTTIEEMLRNGTSADDIIQQLNIAKRKIAAEKQLNERKSKISDLRQKLITAIINYYSFVAEDELSKEEINHLTDYMNSRFEILENFAETATNEKLISIDEEDAQVIQNFVDNLFKF